MPSLRNLLPVAALSSLFSCVSCPALAGDDALAELLNALRKAKDAGERRTLATKLSLMDSRKSVETLSSMVREDTDPGVRAVAAEGLGRMTVPGIAQALATLLTEGNIVPVRRALASSLGRFPEATRTLHDFILAPSTGNTARLLAIEALGFVPAVEARQILSELATSPTTEVRCTALRAFGARADVDRDRILAMLQATLQSRRDVDTLMAAMDVAESRPDERLIPSIAILDSFLEPCMISGVAHLRAVLEGMRAKAARIGPGDRYGAPVEEAERNPPPQRARYDIVFAFDATGSVTGKKDVLRDLIRDRHRFLIDLGADVRVGIVAYRETARHLTTPALVSLPLTHDPAKVDAFVEAIEPSGSDSQGAAIDLGLEEGMDRMIWRANATKRTWLIADSRCSDAARSRRIASIHRAAGGTRLHVCYLLRTRSKVPECVEALAQAAGTVVELLE